MESNLASKLLNATKTRNHFNTRASQTFQNEMQSEVPRLRRENDLLKGEITKLKREITSLRHLNEELVKVHKLKNLMFKDFTKMNFNLQNKNDLLNKEKCRLFETVQVFKTAGISKPTEKSDVQSVLSKTKNKNASKMGIKRTSMKKINFLERLNLNFNNANKTDTMRLTDLINGQTSILLYDKSQTNRIFNNEKWLFITETFKNYHKFKESFENFDDFEMDDMFYLLKSLLNDYSSFLTLFSRLNRLFSSTSFFSRQLILSDSFPEISAKLKSILNCAQARFFMIDKGRYELWSRLDDSEEVMRIPLDKGVTGKVAESGCPAVLDEAESDPRFDNLVDNKKSENIKTLLVWPVFDLNKNKVIAVFQAVNKIGRHGVFDQNDRALANVLAEMLANQIKSSLDFSDFSSSEYKLKQVLNVLF